MGSADEEEGGEEARASEVGMACWRIKREAKGGEEEEDEEERTRMLIKSLFALSFTSLRRMRVCH